MDFRTEITQILKDLIGVIIVKIGVIIYYFCFKTPPNLLKFNSNYEEEKTHI